MAPGPGYIASRIISFFHCINYKADTAGLRSSDFFCLLSSLPILFGGSGHDYYDYYFWLGQIEFLPGSNMLSATAQNQNIVIFNLVHSDMVTYSANKL